MSSENSKSIFIKADEIMTIMDISRPYAYRIIKKLNDELTEKGALVIQGRTNREYFYQRLHGNISA